MSFGNKDLESLVDEKVDTDLTRKIAHLAQLDLSETELKTFAQQFFIVLKYFDLLNEVNVEGISPLVYPQESECILREDEIKSFAEDLVDCSVDTLYKGFKVPSIM